MEDMKFRTARKIMARGLKEKGLRQAYQANIALLIYDARRPDGRLNLNECKVVAERLIAMIWG
jgi:hypothetical protein